MPLSKGKKLMAFRKLSGHSEYLLFIHIMQSVRSVQDCTSVLYEPANWCYIYIYIQGVPGGKDLTSGECSLGQ